ncbi:hypothetical protein [Nonomuraea sp. NPDC049625]|uniref:hypothetical protein n=1 Tax=Nonomuraea sp. NPDC049625 TaxID=3155775 RepID=UPI0034366223
MAELALGCMRAKIGDLSMALEGRFNEHHALMCRLHLQHLDLLDQRLAKLDAQVEEMMVPFRLARELMPSIPRIGPIAAVQVIGEIGVSPHFRMRSFSRLAALESTRILTPERVK